jgi:peptide/nickel transport system permease protein
MKRFVISRIFQGIVTLFGITVVTFLIAQFAPGDPLSLGESDELRHEQVASKGPIVAQYFQWLTKLIRFDLGTSTADSRMVSTKIFEAIPVTLAISLTALALSWGIAIFLSWVMLKSRVFAKFGEALLTASAVVPPYWLALLLLFLFANPNVTNLFPFHGLGSGDLTDTIWHLFLPICVMTFARLGQVTRQVSSALETMSIREDVLAAKSRGLSNRTLFWQYVVRGALVPLLSFLGLSIPSLLGGSVVIEKIFGIPGMGLLAFDSIGLRDYPTVMGVATVMASVTLVTALITDLACAYADPRIRLENQP